MVASYFILALGFLAQSFFGARTVAQWILSEKAGRVVSPSVFWIFSLCGSALFMTYGIIRLDLVIVIGQFIAYYIYIRNLQLKGVWHRIPFAFRILLFLLPGLLFMSFTFTPSFSLRLFFDGNRYSDAYFITGAAGQLLLNFRYFYQWYFSEKANESLLPLGFWVISACASLLVIVYSVYRDDLVLLVAQSAGLLAYARNIYFHFHTRLHVDLHP